MVSASECLGLVALTVSFIVCFNGRPVYNNYNWGTSTCISVPTTYISIPSKQNSLKRLSLF